MPEPFESVFAVTQYSGSKLIKIFRKTNHQNPSSWKFELTSHVCPTRHVTNHASRAAQKGLRKRFILRQSHQDRTELMNFARPKGVRTIRRHLSQLELGGPLPSIPCQHLANKIV